MLRLCRLAPLILPLDDGTIVRSTGVNSWSNIARARVEVGEGAHVGLAATNPLQSCPLRRLGGPATSWWPASARWGWGP